MDLKLHPEIKIVSSHYGEDKSPILIVDNFLANAEQLIDHAAEQRYGDAGRYYPGMRVKVPEEYLYLLADDLKDRVFDCFQLAGDRLRYSANHYSIVTTPPEKLNLLQRIPHFDALDSDGLAMIHYLFKKPLGGTAFYRHRKTGFEYIDESRKVEYFQSLESENDGSNMPGAAYINSDTPLFEQTARQEGIFNRVLIYRRNTLHSGCIAPDFVPDSNPRTGRLTVTCFIDVI